MEDEFLDRVKNWMPKKRVVRQEGVRSLKPSQPKKVLEVVGEEVEVSGVPVEVTQDLIRELRRNHSYDAALRLQLAWRAQGKKNKVQLLRELKAQERLKRKMIGLCCTISCPRVAQEGDMMCVECRGSYRANRGKVRREVLVERGLCAVGECQSIARHGLYCYNHRKNDVGGLEDGKDV